MAGLEIVSGGIVGVAFQLLYDVIKHTKARCNNFKPTLDSLENKINLLTPKIHEMDRLNQELGEGDNPKEEILLFTQQLEKARVLVALCSKLKKRNIHKKSVYAKRLDKLDSSLEKLLNVEFLAGQAVEVKRIMVEILKMNKKLDAINLPDASASDSSSSGASVRMCGFSSTFVVGFEQNIPENNRSRFI